LSFIPAGVPRSIAEYVISAIPGALLLFGFFLASESAVVFLGGNTMAVTFLPVICLMPLLSGAISSLVLEKIRSKLITYQRGALVGAFSGFVGSLVSVLLLMAVFLLGKKPFGTVLDSTPLVVAALFIIIAMDTLLAALGGAIAVRFLKDF
jgi:hypothetical protein